jgi:hypothetical protein
LNSTPKLKKYFDYFLFYKLIMGSVCRATNATIISEISDDSGEVNEIKSTTERVIFN